MNKQTFLIWDLLTRIFHWLLTGGFITTATIAFLADEKSRQFPYHAIIGLALALMIALRVIWAIIGTRYARFTAFHFGPRDVVVYLKEAIWGGGTRHIGHNPGSAYAIIAMLVLMLGISVTGILSSRGNHGVKEAHEVMSYAMLAVVATHVLGVVFHTVRHGENITLSMFTGRKVCEPSHAIASARPIAAAVFIVMVGAWTLGLVRNYDAAAKTTTIPILGTRFQLSENEKAGKQEKPRGKPERKHHDD